MVLHCINSDIEILAFKVIVLLYFYDMINDGETWVAGLWLISNWAVRIFQKMDRLLFIR